ncbi:DUF2264 domain-containing protein [Photobacterium aphoticum]|uniref:DUF2264 domain-containing protein n=1 Tax=Photobacterium aphoticum TaxID=754436 RepID=A0A0J1JCZ0_9GAMM|nr:DUF2264 domain-containing protein [Photobacterium aphoticum]KLU99536.1 hypothetical protein ABT58_16970 [Photobacterium aphoticum]PSU57090.1 DUF2264 domain-containing protein [Photobacterium aphoticum]GHA53125.1 hypothetical protein GCM10007086_29250 [Photobacterium aphoticum]
MQKDITATARPIIPYEHPDLSMYLKLMKENAIRLRYRKKAYTQHDAYIQQLFSSENPLKQQCDDLVRYVAEAFEHYAMWDYTHAYYPGRPSQQTARTDAMEGCSRVLPTLAAWLSQQQEDSPMLQGITGKPLDVTSWIHKAFLAGTDPQHPGYWGTLHDYDQRTCESADLALALWLSRKQVWDTYNTTQQRQIIDWFKQVNHCQTVDNNWHLFPLTVQLVVKALTGEDHVEHVRYERTKAFYVGDGWFRDGAKGNYDYYNAWGFFYSLYWLDCIDPAFDPEFIRTSLNAFSERFRYFFTPQGLPLFGRSACYRLAAASPLLATLAVNHNAPRCDDAATSRLSIGETKRAFRVSLDYFIANGALKNGAPTQGVFSDDPRLVDNYSGPASSFWSLRALNIALFCGDKIGLWQAEESPLAIEQQDFMFDIPAIEATVIGTFKTKEVVVIFRSDYTQEQSPPSRRLETQTYWKKMQEILTGRAERPKNNLLRKGITCYSSKMSHFF